MALIPYVRRTKMEWAGDVTIAHAGGIIDGNAYSNSLDALERNYSLGQRTFEIDMILSSDNQLVCRHDWDFEIQEGHHAGEVLDENTFMSIPIMDKYTPMSFATLCEIMEKYPDIWIITDTKYSDTESVQLEFNCMADTARQMGAENVLNRIIVQIYTEDMYDTIKEIYPFQSWIFTLYQIWDSNPQTFPEFARFCYNNDIPSITTWNKYINSDIMEIAEEYHINVYAHTENDVEDASELFEQGVKGIYTDSITPDLLEGIID